ncbi:MAG: PEP-CTERM sorting domain-containing protein [Tepidisphaeraceae bacterium]
MKTSKTNFRFVAASAAAGLVGSFFLAGVGMADTYTEGFEGASYNLAATGAGSATLSTAEAHSGAQSVLLSLQSSSDYARVKLDVTSVGMTLGGITSADYWINKSAPLDEQAPYLLLSIAVPGQDPDGTLAIMYNNPGATAAGWQDLSVDTGTLFHVQGADTSGLATPSSMTLGQIDASTYSPGVTWGSLPVDYVRIGYGSGGDDSVVQSSYVDDLSINYTPVPEPASFSVIGLGAVMLLRRRRRA